MKTIISIKQEFAIIKQNHFTQKISIFLYKIQWLFKIIIFDSHASAWDFFTKDDFRFI
jgi:hypothetical protein